METRKNILDLEHQRYLQFYNTTIIILFTFLIGIGISFLTKQINPKDYIQILGIVLISSIVFVLSYKYIIKFNKELKRIKEEIKRL